MTPQEHARDLFIRLSAIRPEHPDDIANLLVKSIEDAMKDERERIERRDAVAAHPGWQSMETAPKDGRDVYLPIKAELTAYWCKDLNRWVLSRPLHMEFVREPKGWRPTGSALDKVVQQRQVTLDDQDPAWQAANQQGPASK